MSAMFRCAKEGTSQRVASYVMRHVSVSSTFLPLFPESCLFYDSEHTRRDISASQEEELSDTAIQGGARPSTEMKPAMVGTQYMTVKNELPMKFN